MQHTRRSVAVAVLAGLLATGGCADPGPDAPRLRVEVVGTRPHDPRAFTQGLEVHGDVLYEGTGLAGRSTVRATDLRTGAELARVEVPAPYFGEGITRAGDTLWQLTWREGTAFARDPVTLAVRAEHSYDGEGWGLCARDGGLVMSDGSNTLTFRDPVTFAITGTTDVDFAGARLNELECAADGSVYANDYPTDRILRIDPESGALLGVADASGLLPRDQRAGADVLNGIAQLPGTDRFLVTGKYWPTMFEVRFVPE
ncbi:glutaminyl-peptide cyclotransferase [Nocardia puris]|uniref:Glutamine cyclotransferase n=1 Tax=Nocardia puris TaxID=208602 RepID=A0A366DA13_9NOCA|nr:glutaminyl-peptide cyclotransferase [Nocardia puris]MBF6211728.1 glutaminyl-peptide cyclotransferase [Nocardia puris]MBF6365732.1 glutaminyl-peptide cyclotransferase [Nocardia puris]MBF6460626.1 glutaminyl-peptide cyclotransferase [Nocardia puris]RBO86902.1 glutamine cyclotransferase [Nocardia puris]